MANCQTSWCRRCHRLGRYLMKQLPNFHPCKSVLIDANLCKFMQIYANQGEFKATGCHFGIGQQIRGKTQIIVDVFSSNLIRMGLRPLGWSRSHSHPDWASIEASIGVGFRSSFEWMKSLPRFNGSSPSHPIQSFLCPKFIIRFQNLTMNWWN